MALLQNNKAIFYHPLNDADEYIKSKTWTGTADTAGTGKIGNAMSRVDISASLSGSTVDYNSVAGETKVAFCGWFNRPSTAPPQTSTPTTDSPIIDAATSVSGTGVNGATVEVFVNGGSVGNANAAVSGGTWSKTGMAALSTGDTIKAKQRLTGELQSNDSNEVTVSLPSGAVTHGSSTIYSPAFGGAPPYRETRSTSLGKLDSSRFVICYGDEELQAGYARVGTINGSDVTFGSAALYGESNRKTKYWGNAVAVVDSATFVAVSCKSTGNDVYATVGTVSGTDITFGSNVYVGDTTANEGDFGAATAAVHMGSGAVVVLYHDDNYVRAKVGTVSGSDITFGAEYSTGMDNGTLRIVADRLSSTRFVAAATRDANTRATAVVGVVAGTTLSFGSVEQFGFGITYDIDVAAINSTQFVVCYWDNDPTAAPVRTRVCTANAVSHAISLGSVSYPVGTSSVAGGSWLGMTALSATRVVLCFQLAGTAPTRGGVSKVGDISGSTITWRPSTSLGDVYQYVPLTNTIMFNIPVAMSSTKFVVGWVLLDNSPPTEDDVGYAVVGDVTP